MPDRLIFPYHRRMEVAGWPQNIQSAVTLLIMSLLSDPVPPDAKPFVESSGHSSYAVSNDLATVFYTVLGDDTVYVNAVQPNT